MRTKTQATVLILNKLSTISIEQSLMVCKQRSKTEEDEAKPQLEEMSGLLIRNSIFIREMWGT